MFRVEFPGPFTRHEVVVDGWTVPLLSAQPCGPSDENVMLILDERIAVTLSVDEAERVVPFLADSIAVALGYTSHPNEATTELPAKQPQLRPVRIRSLDAVSSDDAAAA